MAFSLTTVDRSYLPEDGGYKLVISGSFEFGHNYRVHIGTTESTSDPTCYTGIAGQGVIIVADNTIQLICYSPIVPVETTLSVFVIDVDTSEDHTLSGVLESTHRQFAAKVFAYRKVLPLFYRTGPRQLLEEPITT